MRNQPPEVTINISLQLAQRLLCSTGKDGCNYLLSEKQMNTLSSKLTTFAAALAMNGLILGALGFLFELQSHPLMS
jgi:hypothetical protein